MSHYQNFTPPFAIPASWEWVQLPEVCLIPITDGTHKTPTYSDRQNGVPFLSSKDVTSRRIEWSGIRYITKELHEELFRRLSPQRNDILLAKNGTTGVAALVDSDEIFDIYVTLALIRPVAKYVNPQYLFNVINSPMCKKQFDSHLTGIGLPNLHLTDIQRTLIPLPPFKEQCRIVELLEQCHTLVDDMELEHDMFSSLVLKTKSKILELAMQGKLVPQDPADEPAADMLRRVNPNAKVITDNPHSWNIPLGWVMSTLKDLIESPSSKQYQILQSEIEKDGLIPVISQSANFIEGYSDNEDKVFYPNEGIVIFGDHTKNIKFFSDRFIIGADGVKLIDWSFEKRFLFYLIKYVAEKIPSKGYSRHFQYLQSYVIGLPPLEEQKRIVAKIEELYACLDEIVASLQS